MPAGARGARMAHVRRSARQLAQFRLGAARSRRRTAAARAHRQNRAARRLGRARRHLAGVARGDRRVGGQALLRAWRRRLARRGRRRVGQPVEHAHARRIDGDDAAHRAHRRRRQAAGPALRRRKGAADGRRAVARPRVAQGPDSRGVSQSRAVSRRDRRVVGAVADLVRQGAFGAERTRGRARRRARARAECAVCEGRRARVRDPARDARPARRRSLREPRQLRAVDVDAHCIGVRAVVRL